MAKNDTTATQNYTMEEFTGDSVEVHGWWTPEQGGATLKGILVGFISKDKSDKLKSDMLVFELVEDLPKCKDADDTSKIVTIKKGRNVATAYYTDLQGLYPQKLGHVCHIHQKGAKKIPGQSDMKLFSTQSSTKPVRNIAPAAQANGAAHGAEQPVPFET